jgi:hypothetical protein
VVGHLGYFGGMAFAAFYITTYTSGRQICFSLLSRSKSY